MLQWGVLLAGLVTLVVTNIYAPDLPTASQVFGGEAFAVPSFDYGEAFKWGLVALIGGLLTLGSIGLELRGRYLQEQDYRPTETISTPIGPWWSTLAMLVLSLGLGGWLFMRMIGAVATFGIVALIAIAMVSPNSSAGGRRRRRHRY